MFLETFTGNGSAIKVEERQRDRKRGQRGGYRTNYPSSSSLLSFPKHPAILRESLPKEPHALIAAYGDAMGLPMDWTKSRALCNPLSPLWPTPVHPSSLYLPSRSPSLDRGRVYSFQFARVVHSTADRKILGEEIFFLFVPFRFSSPISPLLPLRQAILSGWPISLCGFLKCKWETIFFFFFS